MLTDNDLLAFKTSSPPGSEPGDARRLLYKHGDVFRTQLVSARWLEGHFKRRKANKEDTAWPRRSNAERDAGFEEAIRDVVVHLRQGECRPSA